MVNSPSVMFSEYIFFKIRCNEAQFLSIVQDKLDKFTFPYTLKGQHCLPA